MSDKQELDAFDACESSDSSWNDVIKKKIIKFREEYRKHMSAKPADYRPDLAYDAPINLYYREWIRRKVELEEFLSVFDLSLKAPRKSYDSSLIGHNVPRKLSISDRGNMEAYHKTYLECLELLKKLEHGSNDWHTIRCRCNNLRNAILKMAEKHKIEIPKPFPIVPRVDKNNENQPTVNSTKLENCSVNTSDPSV